MNVFKDIKGNVSAKKILQESLENGHVLHNYLFLGGDHENKYKAAQILAQAILCQEKVPPCGVCSSCSLFQSSKIPGQNHPDFMEIFPSKTSSKTSIKKSAVVELIESTLMKAYKGKAKVYLIHDFDTMTVEGQNALLKTLEEPLEGVYFILLSKSKENILPTVLSRSNQILFEGLLEEEIYTNLREKGYSSEMTKQLIAQGGGSYTRAQALATNADLNELRRQTFEKIHKVVTQAGYTALATWEFFQEKDENLEEIFFFLESWARDIIVYYSSFSKDRIANADFADFIIEEVNILQDRCPQMMEIILRTRQYLHYNGNKQLVIEGMLLEIGG